MIEFKFYIKIHKLKTYLTRVYLNTGTFYVYIHKKKFNKN